MKKQFVIIMGSFLTFCAIGGIAKSSDTLQFYSLRDDFSTTQNPNGVWSYNLGGAPITKPISGYADGWCYWGSYDASIVRVVTEYGSSEWKAGDIMVHACSLPYGGASSYNSITWTSPSAGTIDISGQAWAGFFAGGRDASWSLTVNGAVVASRSTIYGTSRTDVVSYFNNNLTPNSTLSGISVSMGDVVEFTTRTTTYYGHFVGVDMDITLKTGTIAVTDLALGTFYDGNFVSSSQAQFFRVHVPESHPMRVILNDNANNNYDELYVKFDAPPTRGNYDYRYSHLAFHYQEVLVPMAYAGDWYILVYGNKIATPSNYTLIAEMKPIILSDISPKIHGDIIDTVFTLKGAGFEHMTQVNLVSAEASYPAAIIKVVGDGQAHATFTAKAVPAGIYSVEVVHDEGHTDRLDNVFEMVEGGLPKLETNLILPSRVGYHQLATIYVEYSNTGYASMPAPVLVVNAMQSGREGALLTLDKSILSTGFWTSAMPEGFKTSVQLLASGDTPGVLHPGETKRVPIYYTGWLQPWNFSYPRIDFTLKVLDTKNNSMIDWDKFESEVLPQNFDVYKWKATFAKVKQLVGDTWGQYCQLIIDQAIKSEQNGEVTYDVSKLFSDILNDAHTLTMFDGRTIVGRVFLEDSGEPVSGARVFAFEQDGTDTASTLTDNDGWYVFQTLNPGIHQLELEDYLLGTDIIVNIDGSRQLYTNDLPVTVRGTITGTVADSSGSPLESAIISVTNSNIGTFYATTDEVGFYKITTLPTGENYTITCEANEYIKQSIENIYLGSTLNYGFELIKGATITGRVLSADSNQVIEGASILLFASDGNSFAETTNSIGQYTMQGIPSGQWTLYANHAGFLSTEGLEINIEASSFNVQDIYLTPDASIEGIVTSAQGFSVNGVILTATGSNESFGSTQSNNAGETINCSDVPILPEEDIRDIAWDLWIFTAPGIYPTSANHLRKYLNGQRDHINHYGNDIAIVEILNDNRWKNFDTITVRGQFNNELKDKYEDQIMSFLKRKPTGVYLLPNVPSWENVSGNGLFWGPGGWVFGLVDDLRMAYGGIDKVHITPSFVIYKEKENISGQNILRYRYFTRFNYHLEDEWDMEDNQSELECQLKQLEDVYGYKTDITHTWIKGEEFEEHIDDVPLYKLNTSVNLPNAGKVNENIILESGEKIDSYYTSGTKVKLEAVVVNNNYEFSGWTGDLHSTEATILLTMNSDKSINAIFKEKKEEEECPNDADCDGIPDNQDDDDDNDGIPDDQDDDDDGDGIPDRQEHCDPPFQGPCNEGEVRTSCGCFPDDGQCDPPFQGPCNEGEVRTDCGCKPDEGECDPPFVGPCLPGEVRTSCGCKPDSNDCEPPFVGPCNEGEVWTPCGCKPEPCTDCNGNDIPEPNTPPDGNGSTGSAGSLDPNKKFGPAGHSDRGFIKPGLLMPYNVEFENDPNATAPAQIVTVTDQLDSHLDWTTFELTEIAFGEHFISVPAKIQHFEWTEPMHYNGLDFEVQIEAGIHLATGEMYANFYSIDPAVGLPPGVDYGFLPPEDGSGRGMGHISYVIRQMPDLTTGTEIRNIAHITFDFSETIATNQVDPHDPTAGTDPNLECLNTIDTGSPESFILPLPAVSHLPFILEWSGIDMPGESGIAGYDIYISVDGEPYTLLLRTSDTSAIVNDYVGSICSFYSIAVDNASNHEYPPNEPDAITFVTSGNEPPIADAGPDQVVHIGINNLANVTLDGSGSNDSDGSITNYVWTENGSQIATAVNSTITLPVGQHTITLQVTDNGGLTDTNTVVINVLEPPTVDNLVSVSTGLVSFDRRTGQYSTLITIKNKSTTEIGEPVWLVIDGISNPAVTLANPEGITADGKQYFDLSSLLGDGKLSPNETIQKRVYFNNPSRLKFTFTQSMRGIATEEEELPPS